MQVLILVGQTVSLILTSNKTFEDVNTITNSKIKYMAEITKQIQII